MIVSPNPIRQGETTASLLPNHSPCDFDNMREGINYKEIYGENYQIKVYDFYGEQKYEGEFQLVEDDQIYKFNVPNLFIPDNYYILEITYPDQYIERQTIIIQKE